MLYPRESFNGFVNVLSSIKVYEMVIIVIRMPNGVFGTASSPENESCYKNHIF